MSEDCNETAIPNDLRPFRDQASSMVPGDQMQLEPKVVLKWIDELTQLRRNRGRVLAAMEPILEEYREHANENDAAVPTGFARLCGANRIASAVRAVLTRNHTSTS